jgi:hypothetical protein
MPCAIIASRSCQGNAGSGAWWGEPHPRLAEPVNAAWAGVDLVTPLLDLATGQRPRLQGTGLPGVRTHQVLLAVLGAAQHGRHGGRRRVTTELVRAALRRRDYRGSAEELTPLRSDPLSAIPVAIAAASSLVRPASSLRFTSGSVSGYALTRDGWRRIQQRHTQDRAARSHHPQRGAERLPRSISDLDSMDRSAEEIRSRTR